MHYKVEIKIKDAIEARDIKQKDLAEMAEIRESTISDIVRGTRTVINFEHLAKIATALNVNDIRELIDLVEVDD